MENKKVNINLKQYSMLLILVAVYILFAILTKGKNLSGVNVNNLIMQNGYVIILAVGMLLCVLTGNVDLGVGSIVAVCGAVVGITLIDAGLNMWVAILLALAAGTLIGVFDGFFIAYVGIPPFIVTLATMLMGRGLTYTVLQAQTKGPFEDNFKFIGSGFLPSIKIPLGFAEVDLICLVIAAVATAFIIIGELRDIASKKKYGFAQTPGWQLIIKDGLIIFIVWFVLFKLGTYNGIPFQLLLIAIIVGFYYFLTSMTVPGRQIYALGGNAKAAQLSGINTKKVFFWVYTNMGILSAVAGIVLAARNGSATPKAGDGFEMDAIASCYIGGAATAGGIGTIIGAVVGAFIMGVLNNGMSLYGFSTDIQKIVKGAVLLGAVTLDLVSKRKK